VLPIKDSSKSTAALVEILRGYKGLNVISLANPEAVLGKTTAQSLGQCSDDTCLRTVLRPLSLDLILHGSLLVSDSGKKLYFKLVSTSTKPSDYIAMSSQYSIPDARTESVRIGLLQVVGGLFAEFGLQAHGLLRIESDPQPAAVTLDGVSVGQTPIGPLRLPAGKHKISMSRSGHRPWSGQIDLKLGHTTVVRPELELKRSKAPLYLGATAGSFLVAGLIFGMHANQLASAWSKACVDGRCETGFSAQRHASESRVVDVERTVANSLFATAFGLGASARVYYLFDDGESGE